VHGYPLTTEVSRTTERSRSLVCGSLGTDDRADLPSMRATEAVETIEPGTLHVIGFP
jgi:hypothetical protein